jgi:hypothetical protein
MTFSSFARQFSSGLGDNVTVRSQEQAFGLAEQLTTRASDAGEH